MTTVRVVHDPAPTVGRHLCLHSVATHKLCVLPRGHKGPHLPLPKIPEREAA